MSNSVGKSIPRVDAFDKVTGRARYTDDLCGREALVVRVFHATIAHGYGHRRGGGDSRRGAGIDLF